MKKTWETIGYKMRIISLGLGVQSTTLYLMSSTGIYQRADYAIFADPGAEHPKTYELLKWLLIWQKENDSIPIYVEKKDLYRDLINDSLTENKFAPLPTFTKDGKGILRRQCTAEYKIRVIHDRVKSSCIFCPYSSNTSWKRMKKNKGIWSKIIKIDESLRKSNKKGLNQEVYLHHSCKPIDEAYLQEDQEDLFENECEGYCGL